MDRSLRGKCKDLSYAAVEADPTLRIVRGYYWCPIWNKEEQHWWTEKEDGSIYDPTAAQYPSNGLGTYTEFTGMVVCEECGLEVPKEKARIYGSHAVCSGKCASSMLLLN